MILVNWSIIGSFMLYAGCKSLCISGAVAGVQASTASVVIYHPFGVFQAMGVPVKQAFAKVLRTRWKMEAAKVTRL
jgi:hypothetical protein